MYTLFYGWAVFLMVIGVALIVGIFAWMHGYNYGRRQEIRRNHREREIRKIRDQEFNIINRIKNQLTESNELLIITPPVCGPTGHLMTVHVQHQEYPSIEPLSIAVDCSSKTGTITFVQGGYVGVVGVGDLDKAVQVALHQIDLSTRWQYLDE